MRQPLIPAVTGVLLISLAAAQTNVSKKENDPKEIELFTAVARENDPAQKLVLLSRWSEQFPESRYRRERNLHYVVSYSSLETRAVTPNAPSDFISQGEQAARTVVEKSPSLFAPEMAPETVTREQWEIARQEALRQAHSVLAVIASNRKEFGTAETEFLRLLELVPDDGGTALRLGMAIVNQKQAERYPAAIFYVARAESLFRKEEEKKVARQYLEKVYTAYHGDLSGLDQVRALAAGTWAPPADWRIASIEDLGTLEAEKEAKFREQFPEIAVWRDIRQRLQAPGGADYFAQNLKGNEFPELRGRLASVRAPGELLVIVDTENANPVEATLRLRIAPKTKLLPGMTVQFTGVAVSFTAQPFMLVLDVDSGSLKITP